MRISLMCAVGLSLVTCAHAAVGKPPPVSAELRRELDRYNMTYGECARPSKAGNVVVRWALFRPQASSLKLPVLVFFPGLGELGPDPARMFGNRGIFNLVTSPDFQKKRPCVFVALQTESGVERHCLAAGRAEPSLAALQAALDEALSTLGSLRIDRERIYLTGLSAGGGACCSMICAYPGRFAGAMPVSAVIHPELLSPSTSENIWMMYNSGEYNGIRQFVDFDALSREMASRGGDFRVAEFTGQGHNAWDNAWREEAAWDWLFSKRARPTGCRTARVGTSAQRTAGAKPRASAPDRTKWKCSASASAESDFSQPRFGADGLAATMYRSSEAAKKGDWWQVEFDSPRKGAMRLHTGDDRGRCRVLRGSVLLSSDGRHWTKAAAVRDGTASFRVDRAVKCVRLQVDAPQEEQFAVRELDVQ